MQMNRRGSGGVVILAFILIAVSILAMVLHYYQTGFSLKQGLQIPLDRVVNAPTTSVADSNLADALRYMQENQLTKGNTSYFVKSDKSNDLTYFYNNLLKLQTELKVAVNNKTQSQLEESNLLMRVREVISDGGVIKMPANMAYYPNLMGNLILSIISWVILVVGFLTLVVVSKS